MPIREVLTGVKTLGYDAALGTRQPAQHHLRASRAEVLTVLPPAGYLVRVSGAAVNLPRVPWLAVLSPEVTKTAQSGLYIVYLYRADLAAVYLSMNQGATAHREYWQAHPRSLGMTIDNATIADLVDESTAIRAQLPATLVAGTAVDMDLGSAAFLPKAYEAGDIFSVRYDLADMPAEAELRDDLARFLRIYDASVDIRARLTATDPRRFQTPVRPAQVDDDGGGVFRPKDASDYVAQIQSHTQVRTRRHESVVDAYGRHAKSLGWKVRTDVHPRDLTLTRYAGEATLCEIKVVRINAEHAVREALGQLITYSHFLYGTDKPRMLAVFSENVGGAFVDLLEAYGIASVWAVGASTWCASPTAQTWGVA